MSRQRVERASIGPYEIVRRVGAGSTASVFEANHVALGKRVAIKLLHEHLADDEQVVGRFLREGRVVACLRHPNIVRVLDVGSNDGRPYLVMEFLSGATLRSLLADRHLLTVEDALNLLLPIAAALAYAHGTGVVHRDLKPANILLAEDDSGDLTPTLVDFGLSKAANAEADVTLALTSSELVAGTVLYMSPEQTFGMKSTSAASDQYSLAAILYEAVTGKAPFFADNVYALIEQIRSEVIKPPSLLNIGVSEDFDDVLLRALSQKPEKRWPSVLELARALLPFARKDTVRAVERDILERPSGSARIASHSAIRVAKLRGSMPISPGGNQPACSEIPLPAALTTRVEPLPIAPGDSPFRIKGNAYRGLAHRARRLLPKGLDGLSDAIEDSALRKFLHQPFLASTRYDLLPIVPISRAFAGLLGVPLADFVREGSVEQATYDARTIFRNLVEVCSLQEMADRIARFGSRSYDFGAFSGIIRAPDHFVLVHAPVPEYVLPWYEPMICAYAGTLVSLMTRKTVLSSTHIVTHVEASGEFHLVNGSVDIRWQAQ